MRRCLLQRIEGTRWVFLRQRNGGPVGTAGGDRRDVSTVPLKGDLFLVQETSRLSPSRGVSNSEKIPSVTHRSPQRSSLGISNMVLYVEVRTRWRFRFTCNRD